MQKSNITNIWNNHFTDLNIVGSRYLTKKNNTKSTKLKRTKAKALVGLWTHKRDPIHGPYRRALVGPFWVLLDEGYCVNLRDRECNCITITYSYMVWNINKNLKRYTNTEKQRAILMPTAPPTGCCRYVATTCSATSDDKAGPMTTFGLVWRNFLKSCFTQVSSCRYHTTNLYDISTVSSRGHFIYLFHKIISLDQFIIISQRIGIED